MKFWKKMLILGGVGVFGYVSYLAYSAYAYNNNIVTGLQEALKGRRFRKAVDLGCGKGRRAPQLRAYSDYLIGIDENTDYLLKASQSGYYDELIEGDIRKIQLPSDVDAVFLLDVIEHLSHAEGEKLLGSLIEVPNVILVTPRFYLKFGMLGAGAFVGPWMGPPHLCLWTVKQLQEFGFYAKIIGSVTIIATRS